MLRGYVPAMLIRFTFEALDCFLWLPSERLKRLPMEMMPEVAYLPPLTQDSLTRGLRCR